MSGYGGPDDESERAMQRIADLIKLSQSQLPKGPGSPTCVECGEPIPEARRKALPGVRFCVDCADNHTPRPKFKEPWAT